MCFCDNGLLPYHVDGCSIIEFHFLFLIAYILLTVSLFAVFWQINIKQISEAIHIVINNWVNIDLLISLKGYCLLKS